MNQEVLCHESNGQAAAQMERVSKGTCYLLEVTVTQYLKQWEILEGALNKKKRHCDNDL